MYGKREREKDLISIYIKEMETYLSVRNEFKYSDDTRYGGRVKN